MNIYRYTFILYLLDQIFVVILITMQGETLSQEFRNILQNILESKITRFKNKREKFQCVLNDFQRNISFENLITNLYKDKTHFQINDEVILSLLETCCENKIFMENMAFSILMLWFQFFVIEEGEFQKRINQKFIYNFPQQRDLQEQTLKQICIQCSSNKKIGLEKKIIKNLENHQIFQKFLRQKMKFQRINPKSSKLKPITQNIIIHEQKVEAKQQKTIFIQLIRKISKKIGNIKEIKNFEQVRQNLKEYIDEIMMNSDGCERSILSYNLKEVLMLLLAFDISRNNCRMLSKSQDCIKQCFKNFKDFEIIQEGVISCDLSENLYEQLFQKISEFLYVDNIMLWYWPIYNKNSLIGFLLQRATLENKKQRADGLLQLLNKHPPNLEAKILGPKQNTFLAQFANKLPSKGNIVKLVKWLQKSIASSDIDLQKQVQSQKTYASLLRGVISTKKLSQLSERQQTFKDYFYIINSQNRKNQKIRLQRNEAVDILEKIKDKKVYQGEKCDDSRGRYSFNFIINEMCMIGTYISGKKGGYKSNVQFSGDLVYSNIYEFQSQFQKCLWKIVRNTNSRDIILDEDESEKLGKKISEVRKQTDKRVSIKIKSHQYQQNEQYNSFQINCDTLQVKRLSKSQNEKNSTVKTKCGYLVFIPSYKEKSFIDADSVNDGIQDDNPYPNLGSKEEQKEKIVSLKTSFQYLGIFSDYFDYVSNSYQIDIEDNILTDNRYDIEFFEHFQKVRILQYASDHITQNSKTQMKTQRFKIARNISIQVIRSIRNLLQKGNIKISPRYDEQRDEIQISNIKNNEAAKKYYQCLINYYSRKANDQIKKNGFLLHLSNDQKRYIKQVVPKQEIMHENGDKVLLFTSKLKKEEYLQMLNIMDMRQQYTFQNLQAFLMMKKVNQDFLNKIYLRQINIEQDPFRVQFAQRYYPQFFKQMRHFAEIIKEGPGEQRQIKIDGQASFIHLYQKEMMNLDSSIKVSRLINAIIIQYNDKYEKKVQNALKSIQQQKQKEMFECLRANSSQYKLKISLKIVNELKKRITILLQSKATNGIQARVSYQPIEDQFSVSISNFNKNQQKLFQILIEKFQAIYKDHLKTKQKIYQTSKVIGAFLKPIRVIKKFTGQMKQVQKQFWMYIEEIAKQIGQNINEKYIIQYDNAFLYFIQNSDFDSNFSSQIPQKASQETQKQLNKLNIFEMFLNQFLKRLIQQFKADSNPSKINKIKQQLKQILSLTQTAFKNEKNFTPFLQNYFKSINIISRIYLGQQLPLTKHLTEFRKKFQDNDVVMVKVGTGSGKSTLLPPYLIGLGYKKVVVTQPRRLPCRQIYKRISSVFGKGISGYMVADGNQDSSNRLIYMTDGLLKTQAIHKLEKTFNRIDVLMIDEIHERSANIDILLILLFHYCRQKKRNIKIILCSATIDTRIGDLMKEANLKIDTFQVETKRHPITQYPITKGTIIDKIVELSEKMKSDEQMLVFVPGIREVNEIVEILRRIFKRQAYPVTANQNPIQQEKNLRIGAIFIATAIAETSLTFRNLKYVIDSRISRLRCFNTEYELMETEQNFSSESSIEQRKGRVGRTCPGQYHYLQYNYYDFKNNQKHNPTELQKADLTPFIFQLLILMRDFKETVSLFERIMSKRGQFNLKIQYSERILNKLNILNSKGSITNNAPSLLKFGNLGSPQHNYAIQLAYKGNCQTNIVYLVAFFMMGTNLSGQILKYAKEINKVQGDIRAIHEFIAKIMRDIDLNNATNIRNLSDEMVRNCPYIAKRGWFRTIVRIINKIIDTKRYMSISIPPSNDWKAVKQVLVAAYSNKLFFNQSVFGGNTNQYEKIRNNTIFSFDVKVKDKTIYKLDKNSVYDTKTNPPKYILAFNCGISPQQQCLLSLCEEVDIKMLENQQITVIIEGKQCDNKYFLGTMPLSEQTAFQQIQNQSRNKYNRIKIDNNYPIMKLTGQFSGLSQAFQNIIEDKRKNKEIRINLRGFLEEAIQNRAKSKRIMMSVIDPDHTRSMFTRLTFDDYRNMFQTIKFNLKNNHGTQLQWNASVFEAYLKLQKIKNIHLEDVVTKLKAFFRWFADSQTICKQQLKIRPRYIEQSKVNKDQIKKIRERINQIVDSNIDFYVRKGWAKGYGISKYPRTARMVAVCWVLTCIFDCVIKGGFIRDWVINGDQNLPNGDLTKLLTVNPRNGFEEVTNDLITPSDIDCQLSNKVLFDEDKFEKEMKKLGISVAIDSRDGWRLHLIFDRDASTGAFTADLIMPYTTLCHDTYDFQENILYIKKDNLGAIGQKIPLEFDQPKFQRVQIEQIINSCLLKKMRPLKADIFQYRFQKFEKRGWKIRKDFCTPTVYKQLFTKSSPIDPNKIKEISSLFHQQMVVTSKAQVVRIQALKNKAWDDAFEAAQSLIITQLQAEKKRQDAKSIQRVESNCKILFHGSGVVGIEGIKRFGFDSRYFKTGGYYGRGAYFADVPSKSHQYAGPDTNGLRRMFIVKVALGKQEVLNASDNNKLGPGIGYHSILGLAGAHREYIIERWGQAKPLFLITYKI